MELRQQCIKAQDQRGSADGKDKFTWFDKLDNVLKTKPEVLNHVMLLHLAPVPLLMFICIETVSNISTLLSVVTGTFL